MTQNDSSSAFPRLGRALGAAALLLASHVVVAADAPQFAAPAASSVTTPVIGTLRVTIAMVMVLGAVLAAAWITRRLRGGPGVSAGSLQVMAQVPLGARERAVLLRVGGRQLLVGVAPGCVRTLHVLEESTPPPENGVSTQDDPARPTFRSVLLRSLGR
jgi:flagellar protein FliO/FliZ